MPSTITIFAGPSLFGAEIDRSGMSGVIWMPPARRGDIAALVSGNATPGIIGLADGTFHAYPAVGHRELRLAMGNGWVIYGLCSIGAIRAAEMRHLGLRPYGRVAQMFCDDRQLADDEVALMHGQEEPFMPLSEPMIHIRAYMADLVQSGGATAGQAEAVLATMKNRWFGERTLEKLRQAMAAVAGADAGTPPWRTALRSFGKYRLKQADLKAFLAERPWTADVPVAHYNL